MQLRFRKFIAKKCHVKEKKKKSKRTLFWKKQSSQPPVGARWLLLAVATPTPWFRVHWGFSRRSCCYSLTIFSDFLFFLTRQLTYLKKAQLLSSPNLTLFFVLALRWYYPEDKRKTCDVFAIRAGIFEGGSSAKPNQMPVLSENKQQTRRKERRKKQREKRGC